MTRIPAGRHSKYNARRTTIDGVRFASRKEAKRYGELRLLEKAGEITDLVLQPEFNLNVPAHRTFIYQGKTQQYPVNKRVAIYRADFQYTEGGQTVIEDVKGLRTPVYRLKKKMVEAQYGVMIRET